MLLFLPYSAPFNVRQLPVVTIFLCIASILVFSAQLINKQQLETDIDSFCNELNLSLVNRQLEVLDKLPVDTYLCALMIKRLEQRPDLTVAKIIRQYFWFDDYSDAQINQMSAFIDVHYTQYQQSRTRYLTQKLMYFPDEPDLLRMITSVFAHGDIWHLLGNLFFLLAFAPAVEKRINNTGHFVTVLMLTIIVTSMSYSLSVRLGAESLPALGLSGVVVTMLALYLVLLPRGKIRFFARFINYKKNLYIYGWMVAVFYIALDVISYLAGLGTEINFVLHLSGLLTGLIAGMILRARLN